jgi:hypothetical protein
MGLSSESFMLLELTNLVLILPERFQMSRTLLSSTKYSELKEGL